MKQESNILKKEQEISTEISDDIEVIGPGRMLSEAREMMGLSQQQVADKLNFRKTLVQEIEAEQFDLTLPAAFNRGYLKNYAKLVNISQDDVLNSYDQLGVAQRQCAEMQSFSKGTEKQAEHNMLMWITYLILIALITATVVWWYQTPSAQPTSIVVNGTNEGSLKESSNQNGSDNKAASPVNDTAPLQNEAAQVLENVGTLGTQINQSSEQVVADASKAQSAISEEAEQISNADIVAQANSTTQELLADMQSADSPDDVIETTPTLVDLVFTFSGDCWVNIYDASGERVAWGVKKSGYVMSVSGQAPFTVTLGKPELVAIEYNDTSVDMSGFNAGNIAKFSLPLSQ